MNTGTTIALTIGQICENYKTKLKGSGVIIASGPFNNLSWLLFNGYWNYPKQIPYKFESGDNSW